VVKLYSVVAGAEGEESTEVARVLCQQGQTLRKLGRVDDAVATLNKAVTIHEMSSDDSDRARSNHLTVLHELSSIMSGMGELNNAIAMAAKRVEVSATASERAVALLELGVLEAGDGDIGAVAPRFEAACAAFAESEEAGGKSHSSAVMNLAIAMASCGEWTGMDARFTEAAEMRVNAFGADHPEVAQVWCNHASALVDLVVKGEALPCISAAQVAEEVAKGEMTEQEVAVEATLRRAHELASKAVELLLAALGPEHPSTQHALGVLGQFQTAGDGGWICDVCRGEFGEGSARLRCVEGCDWDCCDECFTRQGPSLHEHGLQESDR